MFPAWDDEAGVFSLLELLPEGVTDPYVPWSGIVNPVGLDIAYHGMRSGDKFIAPVLYRWIDEDEVSYENDSFQLTTEGYAKLQMALIAMYKQKWDHLWLTYTKQYDPLHTYTLTETGSDSRTTDTDETNTNTKNLTTEDTYEEDSTDANTRTNNLTDNQINKVYGFNSSSAVNESEANATHTGTVGDSGTGSVDSTNTREQTGTDTWVKDGTVGEEGEYTKTRTGNLYRAPSELLSFDREFWLVNFFDIVMADIDKFLTLGIYAENPVNIAVF